MSFTPLTPFSSRSGTNRRWEERRVERRSERQTAVTEVGGSCHSHPHSVRPFLTVTTVPSWVFLRDRNPAALRSSLTSTSHSIPSSLRLVIHSVHEEDVREDRTSGLREERKMNDTSRSLTPAPHCLTSSVPYVSLPSWDVRNASDERWRDGSGEGTVNGRDHYVVDRSLPYRFLPFRALFVRTFLTPYGTVPDGTEA